MGKYMRKRKTKTTGEVVTVLDVSPLGVRTRAKTLALKRLQKSSSGGGDGGDVGGGCYLQLRSRRLEKPLVGFERKRRKHPLKESKRQNRSLRVREMKGQSWSSVSVEGEEEKKEEVHVQENQKEIDNNGSFEGENLLEIDGRERTTRESTPCNLIRDPDNITTPGSSTRPNNASEANGREPTSVQRIIPTAHEMNDFFAGTEEKQQKQFIEKYNFDPVNDKPLPGRYKWVKVDR
ncbi:cyclin-dependent kinase inhibitor 4-like [Solanum stenotomum]|uniref:cyclin-dependent kinase inhibitor 4-like n=1 Tax=Solanum stenotomum TaxID=172797 RepID=UPI0020D14849|nr:cyclin-dependent kinase inhibitor 4-like [Solanum stenotomum]